MEVLQRGRNARTGAKESQALLLLATRPGPRPAQVGSRAAAVDERKVQQAWQREMAKVALFPGRTHLLPMGPAHARALGYRQEELVGVPSAAVLLCAGMGHVVHAGALRPGERVVDVGSGGGLDALLAAKAVGESGRVLGVEMVEELLRKAQHVAGRLSQLKFLKGYAEQLPTEDGSADVVMANGVVNLCCVDKGRVLREMWRVLRKGGRLVIADAVTQVVKPWLVRSQPGLWITEQAGLLTADELRTLIVAAGFSNVQQATGQNLWSATRD